MGEAKEAVAAASRRALEAQKREQNGELKKTLAEMQGMNTTHTEVEKTVVCLSACVQTLGKIVTTFANVKLFWQCVANHSKSLADLNKTLIDEVKVFEAADADEQELSKDDITDMLSESAVNWAALGQINQEAHKAMVSAKTNTDKLMIDLPDGDTTNAKIGTTLKKLQEGLDMDMKAAGA